MTAGKGTFTMTFAGYVEVPSHLKDKIVSDSPFRRDSDD